MANTRRGVVAAAIAIVATAAVLMGISTANAIPQSNPSFPTVTCGGTWHWVHNQLPAGTTGGTLTATFENAGTVTVTGVPNASGTTIHYTLVLAEGDTLLSASDTISGGRLLLSDFPICETTTPPTTTTPPPSSPPVSSPPATS